MQLEDKPTIEKSYERISPTAWGIAWRRTFTDIPYSTEIFEQLKQRHAINEGDFAKVTVAPELTPMFEARYKLCNKLLEQTGIKQVIEIAAGFAPRGLELTKDSTSTFVEFDLPNVIREKIQVVKNILGKESRSNLHFMEGNALLERDVVKAASIFQAGEIAVINEGLLRYLSHAEKTSVAKNILSILKERGGVWITPDIPLVGAFEKLSSRSAEANKLTEDVNKMTGLNESNYFKDEAEAMAFFEKLGFTIEKHSFTEVFDKLSSPSILSLPKETIRGAIEYSEHAVVFVMRAK
jgi:O-methyltransferase involved in polyketide biosynthesis